MCVICLCAGRIGLGWAHDAFCFACHMFMHFPCIRTLFSYIWYIWIAWDFFYCSSLLLPLNLFTLVVSMAPKRKSTPAQNLLHCSASSSTDPSPSTVRFRDDIAFKAFSKNFSRQGIHLKRQVILMDFVDTDLPSIIHSKGWESLCDVPITCFSCLSRSSTPTCTRLIGQYLFSSLAFEVRTFLSHRSLLRMCFGSLG